MKIRIDLKIIFFLALFFISHQLELYILVMFFCFLHECVHLIFAKLLKFNAEEIEIMPFGFFITLKADYKDYNCKFINSNIVELKKVIIAMAGPIFNIILVIILARIYKTERIIELSIYSNLIIFLINLIPIYPLDGGRIAKSLLKIFIGGKEACKISNRIANISVIILTATSGMMILYIKNIVILLFAIYIWQLVITENKKYALKTKIYEYIK